MAHAMEAAESRDYRGYRSSVGVIQEDCPNDAESAKRTQTMTWQAWLVDLWNEPAKRGTLPYIDEYIYT